jgi:mycothiol synthase
METTPVAPRDQSDTARGDIARGDIARGDTTRSETIQRPEAAAIPGLRFRHWRGPDDIPAMAAAAGAAKRAAGSSDVNPVEDMLAQYRHLSNSDPWHDIVVAELDGRIVGYGRTMWGDRFDGTRTYDGIAFVDPSAPQRPIQDALVRLGIERQVSLAAEMAADPSIQRRPAILTRWAFGTEIGLLDLLRAEGFHEVRRYSEMARPDLTDIPEVPVPDGLDLRRVHRDDPGVLRRAWDLGVEVFSEHYGESHPTEADWAQFQESPDTQPHLWCIAVDAATGDWAGHILNYLAQPDTDGSVVGWTESIAVRAPYRRRGLASAMLAESLRIVRDAGAASAALGVDQQNENRAMTLYERLGFRTKVEELELRRPIDVEGGPR